MTPDQSREYDKYYTNTTLDMVCENVNELHSLERKKDNYGDDDREYFFDDQMTTLFKEFFVSVSDHFKFKTILE